MKKEGNYIWKLGLFVALGLLIFIGSIYFLGKQRNLFGAHFELNIIFKNVNGLKVGNNVRFSGIDVGTVNQISLITDTTVQVMISIQNDIQKFIKKDAHASIGSDGLMGDMVLIISPGSADSKSVKNKDFITSKTNIDLDEIKISVKNNLDNLNAITNQLALFTGKMNSGKGALSQLISDEEFSNHLKNTLANLNRSSEEFSNFTINLNKGKTLANLQNSTNEFAKFTAQMNNKNGVLYKIMNDEQFSKSLDSTITNLKTSSKSLSENMEAVKDNYFLKPYFNKQKKKKAAKEAALKKQAEIDVPKPLQQLDTLKK
jgi:phospholipid/cholesterol/gamma-HCH transport system substrate-binding protein